MYITQMRYFPVSWDFPSNPESPDLMMEWTVQQLWEKNCIKITDDILQISTNNLHDLHITIVMMNLDEKDKLWYNYDVEYFCKTKNSMRVT